MPSQQPALSIVIVTLGGVRELGVALPGILAQTIANKIELLVVARSGSVTSSDLAEISGLHSVRLIELPSIGNRGRDAAAGVAEAGSPFIALHENHTRAEPETFERLIAAFRPGDAALCPVIYPANGDMIWGNAMYAIAHADAAPPNTDRDRATLTLHNAVYRTELLRPFGEKLASESRVQTELGAMGKSLRFLPGTVVWHINEARPKRVLGDSFALGRDFGYTRSRAMGLYERAGRAALLPAIAAKNMLRCMANSHRSAATRQIFLRSTLPVMGAALAFATGEVRGYFDRKSAWSEIDELHEFHVRGRLNGRSPALLWLAEAIRDLPKGAP